MEQKLKEFIISRHPYDQMGKEALEKILSKAELVEYTTDQMVYRFGEKLDGLYIIESGKVQITDRLGDVISELGIGNSFGERGLLKDGMAATHARVTEDAQLVCIPADLVDILMKEDRSFREFFDRQSRARKPSSFVSHSRLATTPIKELMSRPPVSVSPETTIKEASILMRDEKISCVLVSEENRLLGILTLRDLSYKAIVDNMPNSTLVSEIMSLEPPTIDIDALANDALIKVAQNHVDHLPIMENGKPVGILTKSNLVSRNALSSLSLVLQISRARHMSKMKEYVSKLPLVLAQLAGSGTAPHIITRLLTDIADACTRRLIELYKLDHGEAPAPFVWAACGSQGRQEQTGVSDQDNCIIYQDGAHDTSWFKGLAKFVCDGLEHVGYFNCPGDMMATNPTWCQPVSVWRGYFDKWISSPTGESQMLASVMFDLRAIYGEASILEDMQEGVLQKAEDNSIFVGFMISNSISHHPPLSLFRGFATIKSGEHKDTVDLKHNGVVPITDMARVFAIKGKVKAVSTRERLLGAVLEGVLSQSGGDDLIAAYDFIQEQRLRHQMRQIRAGEEADNFLAPSSLSELDRSHLRDAFVMVKSMQSAISRQSL